MNDLTKLAAAQARYDGAVRERDRVGRRFVDGSATRDDVSVADAKLATALDILSRAEEAARAHLEGR